MCADVGSGNNFRKVPEECWGRFRRQLLEGSGGFRRVPVFRKVQESSGVVCCLATSTGAAVGDTTKAYFNHIQSHTF